MNCTDADSDPVLSYSTDDNFFYITPSGEVSLKRPLDYENQKQHQIRITVSDRGRPSVRSTVTHVVVEVLNVNDEAPFFSSRQLDLFFVEGRIDLLERLHALPQEPAPHNKTVYVLLQLQDWRMFDVDPKTGDLFVVQSLDHEVSSTYNITVRAQNQDRPALYSEQHVTVHVTDINDNAPICMTSDNMTISRDLQHHDIITTIYVRDADMSSQHRFSLDSKSEAWSYIDPLTGILRVTSSEHIRSSETLNVNVTITDDNHTIVCSIQMYPVTSQSVKSLDASKQNSILVVVIISCSSLLLIITLLAAILLVRRSQKLLASQRVPGGLDVSYKQARPDQVSVLRKK